MSPIWTQPLQHTARFRYRTLYIASALTLLSLFWIWGSHRGSFYFGSGHGRTLMPSAVWRTHTSHLIPPKIWQIVLPKKTPQSDKDLVIDAEKLGSSATWTAMNPGYEYTLMGETSALEYVTRHFAKEPRIIEAYKNMPNVGMKSDFLRYLILGLEGGVYTDTDTVALQPIDDWVPPHLRDRVRLVVGIEFDRRDGNGWYDILHWVQFCQWTIAAAPGHPVFRKMAQRILGALDGLAATHEVPVNEVKPTSTEVMNSTGPAAWTETVFKQLQEYDSALTDIKNLSYITEPKLNIMKRIQVRRGLKEEPRPVDYFELAAGTSTGGIIGLLLFRFRMTATEAIKTYDEIAKDIFKPKVYGYSIDFLGEKISSWVNNSKSVVQNSRFDGESLKRAVQRVVADHGLDKDDKALKGDALLQHPAAGKMIICTTAQDRAETALMKTYKDNNNYVSSVANDIMKEHRDKITICLATRATSAAPTYFPEVKWPEGAKRQLTFWDGGLLNNNPIDQLWNSRYDLVQPGEPEPKISCVISLGTGWERADSPKDSLLKITGVLSTVMAFSTNTNAKAKDFSRHISMLNQRAEHADTKYIRFNPSLGRNKIGLADYNKMELLKKLARNSVTHPKAHEWIEKAVDAICPKDA
ncbi:Calcium-independent phospholipase A2-gamma [Colletotrichum sp. SAR 10_86]|nr:Calcium-independent phospholipase A2-gamma [Colletotrichum sp. SAR 10_86]